MTTPSHSRRLLTAEFRGEAWGEVSGINHQSRDSWKWAGAGVQACASTRPAARRLSPEGTSPSWNVSRVSAATGLVRSVALLGLQ